MRKSFAIACGVLSLALALAPAAFALQGTTQPAVNADIDQLNAAAPSVQQEGSVVVEDETTLDDGTEIKTSASVNGVQSSLLEVFVTGTTDVASDAATADGEGQQKANTAIAQAEATGNTVSSMVESNPDLTEEGVTSEGAVVSTEFYLGIQNVTTGEAYDGDVTAILRMTSAEEASAVVAVLYYDAANGVWVYVPFTCVGNQIILVSSHTGVYRFVSRVA